MSVLSCPHCYAPLQSSNSGKSLECVNRHLFDIAKQGYVNLLRNQDKKSKNPGDTADMVNARTVFLDQGYYQGFAEHFSLLCRDLIGQNQDSTYLDVACGEGYYTEKLLDCLSANACGNLDTFGLDISTPAIKAACKRNKQIQWIVGSAVHLPFQKNSIDLMTWLFCRLELSHAEQFLKPGAFLVIATTGPEHLLEMRSVLYEELRAAKSPELHLPDSMMHVDQIRFKNDIHIDSAEDRQRLLQMTPHSWKSLAERKTAYIEHGPGQTQLDIQIHILQKKTG